MASAIKNRKKLLRFQIPKKSQELIEEIPFKKLIYGSLLINILVITLVFFARKYLPPVVPLYYGLAKSEIQLADNIYLILPSSLSLLVISLNVFLSYLFDNDYVKKVLVASSLVITILTAITTIKIMLLVGSF